MSIRNWNIGVRLGLGFGLVLMLLLTVIAAGTTRFSAIETATGNMIDREWTKAEAANAINATMAANAARTLELFVAPDKTYRDRILQHIDANKKIITQSLDTLDRLVSLPQGKTLLADIKAERARYVTSFTDVSRLIDEAKLDDARKVMLEKTIPMLERLQGSVASLAELQKKVAQDSAKGVMDSGASGRLLMLILGVAAAALGAAAAVAITRSITRPIGRAVTVANTVAAGDLTSVIEITSRDETGQLLRALGEMNDHLATLVRGVRHGTETVASASAQIAAGNLDLSSRTEEQASALEETAASMEELLATVKRNTDSAVLANTLASSASEVALKGGTTVAAVVETMDAINEA